MTFVTDAPKKKYYLLSHDLSRATVWSCEATGEVEIFPCPITSWLNPLLKDLAVNESGWSVDSHHFAFVLVDSAKLLSHPSQFPELKPASYLIPGVVIAQHSTDSSGQVEVTVRFKVKDIFARIKSSSANRNSLVWILWEGQKLRDVGHFTSATIPYDKFEAVASGKSCEVSLQR